MSIENHDHNSRRIRMRRLIAALNSATEETLMDSIDSEERLQALWNLLASTLIQVIKIESYEKQETKLGCEP